MLFLSTLSLRRATQGTRRRRFLYGISIHALLAESDFTSLQVSGKTPISIHALLAESDAARAADTSASCNFYPRSPCGERRCGLRGCSYQAGHFYPRSPCGERRKANPSLYDPARTISIHALLAESDVPHPRQRRGCAVISIHALLAESDGGASSRTPRPCTFLSTLSLRRATQRRPVYRRAVLISIHALLAESDASGAPTRPESVNFYPRSPCGERPVAFMCLPARKYFYPRSPCGERPAPTCSFTAYQ